ncbi:hypothetical protein [Pseudomonas putida]|uniref:hypothetical protein n=1 Tax=Pseudomonas TaxID=286 RepID=UPI00069BF295|nr:hypothetical protein [Pseudomonas putida]
MFVVELERFYTKIFSAGFFYSMVAVFAAGILPGFFLVPAIITVVAFIGWSVVCAYRTERFVTYASFRLFTNLFLGPMLAFALALSVSYKLLKLDPVLVFVLSGAPFAIVGLAYVVVCLCSIDRPVLKVVGGRVDVLESPPSHSPWLAGLSAGVGSLVYSMIREYDDFYLGVIVLTIAISLYTVFYNRHSISSLRALRRQEESSGCQYTFMEIEAIREKRTASLLGRIFAKKHNP